MRRCELDVLPMVDAPKISNADADSIQRCANYVAAFRRNIITESELVTSLFHAIRGCDSNLGIEQCVAQMPDTLHDEIRSRTIALATKDHPGDLFVFQPILPTVEELLDLDERGRHVVDVVNNYLNHPTGNIAYNFDENDLPQKRWFNVRHFDTMIGSKCKKPSCTNDRIKLGVFCPAHHYQILCGTPPPNAT